jgi:hypothetical protein
MTMTDTTIEQDAVVRTPLPPLLPPLPERSSLFIARRQICCTCDADVSRSPKTIDLQGRYHCPDCWSKRVKAGTAVDLVPAGASGAGAAQQAFMHAIGRHDLAPAHDVRSSADGRSVPNSIVVYVAPAPGAAAERGKAAFFSGFYATAGIAAALAIIALGGLAFFVLQAEWQQHRAQIVAYLAGPKETPIEQEPVVGPVPADGTTPPITAVHLDAGVDGDSNLRVAAANNSAQPLKKVFVEVLPDSGPSMASLEIGALDPGQSKTIFVRVPGLSQLAVDGNSVHVRAGTVPAAEPTTPENGTTMVPK